MSHTIANDLCISSLTLKCDAPSIHLFFTFKGRCTSWTTFHFCCLNASQAAHNLETGELSEESELQWQRRCRNKLLANPSQTYQTSVTCSAGQPSASQAHLALETKDFGDNLQIMQLYALPLYIVSWCMFSILTANITGPCGLNVRKMLIPTDRINLQSAQQAGALKWYQ